MSTTCIPMLPETAPFPAGQRAWLNGFFAGLLSSAPSQGTAASGTATASAPAAPPEEESFPWHDPALSMDERLKLAEGKPRERIFMAAMAQLDCGACGYLCKTYGEAVASGTERDLTRCSPGGRETATKLKQLVQLHPPVARSATTPAPARAVEVKYDRSNPFPARFVRSTPLSAAGSEKDVRHVVIDIKNSGIRYKPGDSLGVFAENCAEAVQAVIDLLGARGAEDVPGLDCSHASLREALLRDYSITRPTIELAELLSRCAADAGERDRLNALIAEDGKALGDYQVEDLLLQFRSARPAPADFVSTLSPLQPRLYSISSSPRLHPEEIHLTIGMVKYTNSFGRACSGVASSCLGERMRPGQRVRVFVHESDRFSLPVDGEVPLIMVGPGTGIAPFRAFLQDRKASGARGISWLFFGDQRETFDFLYQDELEQFKRDGVLTRLDTAFSRDQAEKIYVQHRMLDNARQIWDWITSGACVYVCGDAKRMAADVDAALHQIVASEGGMSSEKAKEFVASLARNRRYLRDVY